MTAAQEQNAIKMWFFDHAKPHNISSYNSRAAPSPHTLMRASAPPHLAPPAHAHLSPASDSPHDAQRPVLMDFRTGLWQE